MRRFPSVGMDTNSQESAKMRAIFSFLFLLFIAGIAVSAADQKVMSEAIALRQRGEFEKATRILQGYWEQTSSTLKTVDRQTVEFEVERIRRIRLDYTLTRERLIRNLTDRVDGFTEEEFDQFERRGQVRCDGHRRPQVLRELERFQPFLEGTQTSGTSEESSG